jgi:hypothetical protein
MTISTLSARNGSERGDYGFARVRDIAFDAIHALWKIRRDGGIKQADVAKALNRDPAWVSRQLSGPGNWTLRTIGELMEALDGELEIKAYRLEDSYPARNYDAYSGYGISPTNSAFGILSSQTVTSTFDRNINAPSTSWVSQHSRAEFIK